MRVSIDRAPLLRQLLYRLGAVLTVTALVLLAGTLQVAAQDGTSADASPAVAPPAQAALRINEFMASNGTGITYPGDPSVYPDWVEIYNPGATPVTLNGLSFTDTPDNPARGAIPNGYTVPAGGFVLLYPNADSFLPFGLSADGEYIGLYVAATGELIDEYEFGAQERDVAEGRMPDGTGAFVVMDAPTPGESNSATPPKILSVTRNVAVPASSDVVVVTANVTDNTALTSVTLVYSTTTSADTTLAMTAGPSNTWTATIPAAPNGTIVRYAVRAEDDEGYTSATPRISYLVGYVAPVLIVNEVVAENDLGHEDIDDAGRFPDWAEIYNPGDSEVSLNGLTLTDNVNEPTKYRIPNGRSIAPKSFLLVYLDEEPVKTTPTSKGIHTNFALSAGGEFMGIYGGEGSVLISGISFDRQYANVAIGLYPDGQGAPRILVCTTPGTANVLCEPRAHLPVLFGPLTAP